MPISIPPSVNYQSPLNAIPSRVLSAPKEGNHQIPCEILWGTMGGANKCVAFNIQNNATLEISQIAAIKVDNSACGASIQFIFPDTMETITVPAYMPDAIVPVFSNGLQFYVQAVAPINTDVTRFQLLNFLPPPVVVPTTEEQQTLVVGNISAAAAGVLQILPTNVSGTIQGVQVSFGVASPAGDSNAIITIQDGNAKLIARVPVFVKSGVPANIAFPFMDIDVRFQSGLQAIISGLLIPAGEYNVNLFYRLP